MANVFEGVWNALKHPIDEAEWMVKSTRDVLKGDMDLKDVPGSHQKMMNNITVPILGDNKIAKNSDAVAGAVVGGVLAAPMLGAMGSGGGSAFELGNVGNYMKPGSSGPMGNVSLWNQMKGKVSGALDFGEKDLGKLYGDVDFDDPANDELLGVIADTEGEIAATKKDEPFDFNKMSKVLQSIKPVEGPKVQQAQARAGGFNYSGKQYENPLLTREYQSLYMEPLYKNLI